MTSKAASPESAFYAGWVDPGSIQAPVDAVVDLVGDAFFKILEEHGKKEEIRKSSLNEEEKTGTLRAFSMDAEEIRAAAKKLGPQSEDYKNALLEIANRVEKGDTAKGKTSKLFKSLGCYTGRRWNDLTDDLFTAAEWGAICYMVKCLDSSIFGWTMLGSGVAIGCIRYDRRHGEATFDNAVKKELDTELGKVRTWMHKDDHLHYLLGSLIAVRIVQKVKLIRSLLPEKLPQAGAMVTTGVAGSITGHYLSTPAIPNRNDN